MRLPGYIGAMSEDLNQRLTEAASRIEDLKEFL